MSSRPEHDGTIVVRSGETRISGTTTTLGCPILAVEKAEDITQIQIANPPGSNPKFHRPIEQID